MNRHWASEDIHITGCSSLGVILSLVFMSHLEGQDTEKTPQLPMTFNISVFSGCKLLSGTNTDKPSKSLSPLCEVQAPEMEWDGSFPSHLTGEYYLDKFTVPMRSELCHCPEVRWKKGHWLTLTKLKSKHIRRLKALLVHSESYFDPMKGILISPPRDSPFLERSR